MGALTTDKTTKSPSFSFPSHRTVRNGVATAIPLTITKHDRPSKTTEDDNDKPTTFNNSVGRINGFMALFGKHPDLLWSVGIRIAIAMTLEMGLDGFLKGVVTPMIITTGIGALVAPLTFLLEYSLQPIIHSIAFLVFDDRFLMVTLDATGIQNRLLETTTKSRGLSSLDWHKLSFVEGLVTRYVIKSIAAWSIGLAGLLTVVPVLGQLLAATLTGWIVAWDYVYVPLSGMHFVGPWEQFKTVWQHWGAFQWFGFWSVLLEEVPFLGPTCHVWNVYNAAFFLERIYILNNKQDDDTTVATTGDSSFFEL